MRKVVLFTLAFIFSLAAVIFFNTPKSPEIVSGAPPYGEPETAAPENIDPYNWIRDWTRPEGPAKVALQIGHYQNEQLPDELARIRGNTGAQGGGKYEWEVNSQIAKLTKKLLEEKGIIVEIIPATVPEKYYADAFVAIHADGSENYLKSGFKAASPWRNFSGNSKKLLEEIEKEYETATGLEKDGNITRNMRGYYAFSWWRYTHAVHPMTPSVILETGFLTSPSDRETIVDNPEIPAEGLAKGIENFLKSEGLI